ncbi:uncharacterized protein LOC122667409 [Telopea speciosissima]|uniref:uncharacterized protein LOC122667409 n=1 Tax=Telopea speciosissima TaxID=54955 RepID=UPI001CC715AF|nr:uncharacterized protein LOC122667409 [Telopea speciosissima]
MGSYRKAKLAVDAFRGFASRIVTRAPIGEAGQGFKRQPHTSISGTRNARTFGLFWFILDFLENKSSNWRETESSPSLSWRGEEILLGRSIGETQFQQLKAEFKGKILPAIHPQSVQLQMPLLQKPQIVLVVVLVGSGVLITVYFGSLETIPYTEWNHFVLLPKRIERQIGETQFQQLKAEFKGKILPAIHLESV